MSITCKGSSGRGCSGSRRAPSSGSSALVVGESSKCKVLAPKDPAFCFVCAEFKIKQKWSVGRRLAGGGSMQGTAAGRELGGDCTCDQRGGPLWGSLRMQVF